MSTTDPTGAEAVLHDEVHASPPFGHDAVEAVAAGCDEVGVADDVVVSSAAETTRPMACRARVTRRAGRRSPGGEVRTLVAGMVAPSGRSRVVA